MKLQMTEASGTRHTWTVSERTKFTQVGATAKPRNFYGWSFTDHEGYTRTVEGVWKNLVSELQYTANNYGLSCIIS